MTAYQGVVTQHAGVVNVTCAVQRLWALTPSDRVFQLASLSFDTCLLDITSTFLSGARLHLWQGNWRDEIVHSRCSVVQVTPSALSILQPSEMTSFRVIVPGGEALSLQLGTMWASSHSVFNAYGPTECSIEVAECQVSENDIVISIGFSHPRCNCFVLDDMKALAAEEFGELYIGGLCLSPGYLNRPDLTADRFVQSIAYPFGRLYKTGDRACWTKSGMLLCSGRLDQQVKLRGFRIELGEIESAAQVGKVEGAAAVIHTDPRQLVLYVTPETVDVNTLRESLKTELPVWMLPASIFSLEAFPFTANDKLDRLALAMGMQCTATQRTIETYPDVMRCLLVPRSDVPSV